MYVFRSFTYLLFPPSILFPPVEDDRQPVALRSPLVEVACRLWPLLLLPAVSLLYVLHARLPHVEDH
jgi:hypothetical protein